MQVTKDHQIDKSIGFVGAGQMARALASGFVRQGLSTANRMVASDASHTAAAEFAKLIVGASIADSNDQLVELTDVIFLAVKPQQMDSAISQLRPAVTGDKLFVSIAAGTTLQRLCNGLGTQRVIRVMPNTPCLIGRGAAAFAVGPGVTQTDRSQIHALLSSVGYAVELDESLMDAVTGLSGSGPAYVYQMIAALSEAGVQAGLPPAVATQLAAHTCEGAAAMVLQTGEDPAVLTQRVASPGGTTIAGLHALEVKGMGSAVLAAVAAATDRSRELGESASTPISD